ncbi:MAG: class I SAM-dependent methyltransferase [Acidimicrobiales bacterium]
MEDWRELASARDESAPGWRRHGRRVHLEMLGRWAGPVTGRWLKTDLSEERSPDRALLTEIEGRWVGIDLAAGFGPRLGAGVFLAGDIRRLPFRSEVFDGALSTSTLDHFHDPEDVRASLVELRRVLRRGGLLLLTMDNRSNLAVRARNAMPRLAHVVTGQVPFPVGATVARRGGVSLLSECGFEVTDVDHLLHAPFVLGTRPARWSWWERRVLPAFDLLGRSPLAPFTGHYVAFRAVAS